MTGSARLVVRRCAGTDDPGPFLVCGCCGTRFVPRRARMWLVADGPLQVEICPECILRGPHGAARKLRERIAEGEDRRPPDGRKGIPPEGWIGRMASRVRLLETLECFPLAARQAAVREMREKR